MLRSLARTGVLLSLALTACDSSTDPNGPGRLRITNDASVPIVEAYISKCTDESWGSERLLGTSILPLASRVFELEADCWDALVVMSDGAEVPRFGIDVEAGSEVVMAVSPSSGGGGGGGGGGSAAYMSNGVYITANWSLGYVQPNDRKDVEDPRMPSGSYCPAGNYRLVNNGGFQPQIFVNFQGCSPGVITPAYLCVAKGSGPQPEPDLKECATDPLLTTRSLLISQGVTAIVDIESTAKLIVFYCRAGTSLVGPPSRPRLQCV